MNKRTFTFTVLVMLFSSVLLAQDSQNNYDPLGLAENLEFELNFSSGYSSNLLGDVTRTDDRNYTSSVSIWYNPYPALEIGIEDEYTYYENTFRLSSNLSKFSFGFVPTRETSPWTIYLSGGLNLLRYQRSTMSFDNDSYDMLAAIGWQVADQLSFRTGYGFNANTYIRSEVSDLLKYSTFMGGNWSFLGSNTIDLELGYSITAFSFVPDTIVIIDTLYRDLTVDDYFTDGYLLAFYLSPRFSRSIGPKTGISLEFNYQSFSNEDHSVIIISEFEHISPFAGVSEGKSIELDLKTYQFSNMIVTTGVGYWYKKYLRLLDGPFERTRVDLAERRVDELSRWYLSLELPVAIGHSDLLKSFWKIDYTNNISNFDQFKYYKWAFSTGITYRF